eukprot:COSAG06_NODE_642_length_13482_cov_21.927296_17_plen_254_part_00
MILELSTGGSVQDMLGDPARAPSGQLPLATVRTVFSHADSQQCDPLPVPMLRSQYVYWHRRWMNVLPCLQALRIARHTLNGLVSAHSRYAQSQLLQSTQLVLYSFNTNFHGRRFFSRRSIVHRDVKPDNIMLHLPVQDLNDLQRISAKLLDFGVAVVTETGGNMRDTMVTGTTGLAAQIGTPHFMSPEAFGEETVDARTDIWSVGVTLFLMLTGKLPFEGEGKKRNPHQIGAAVERDTPDFGLLTAAGLPQER